MRQIPVRLIALFALITVIYAVVNSCQAQECVLIENKTDKFTGDRVAQTDYTTLVPGFRVSCKKNNDSFYLNLVTGSMRAFSVDEGNQLIILFTDNSKLVLTNIKYTLSEVVTSNAISFFNASLFFALDNDSMSLLKSKALSSLRIYRNNGYEDGEVKKKRQQSIMEQLKCLEVAK